MASFRCVPVASSVFERWHIDGNIAKAGVATDVAFYLF